MADIKQNDVCLRAEDLRQYYTVKSGLTGRRQIVRALDDVSFEVRRGEVFGLVGESGCGKSTLGLTLCRLIGPTGGRIWLDGDEISSLSRAGMKPYRKKIQMVFQDPYASLNPRMSVSEIVGEPLIIHGLVRNREEMNNHVLELLRMVGLDDYHANRYPHEFSGGQRQRIGIARALAVEPEIIIADEPVSALDVSIQAQVLNLMNSLKKRLDLTYIFISHDLSVVEHISDTVAVMYLGSFVEVSDRDSLYADPLHPYTRALLSAVPIPDPERRASRIILEGSIPSPVNAPSGCKFHTRCRECMDICRKVAPPRVEITAGHCVYCHKFAGKGAACRTEGDKRERV